MTIKQENTKTTEISMMDFMIIFDRIYSFDRHGSASVLPNCISPLP